VTEETRSPIKDKPLRLPGQSLEEERDKLFEDKIETPAVAVSVAVVLAIFEWWRYYFDVKPSPILFTLLFLGTVCFFGWRIWRLRPRFRSLRQGADGEKAVGQFLERLRENGYQVFHDVVAPGFNVDHVLIGTGGVYSIETKTWSKPKRGDARVVINGDRLLIAGKEPDRDPVAQAQAQARWLKGLLADSTGKALEVFPVVLFPGWFIERTGTGTRSTWVLEPKALPAFLEREPARLAPEDVRLASFHLSRYIRTTESSRT
jgi:hypothetical protein